MLTIIEIALNSITITLMPVSLLALSAKASSALFTVSAAAGTMLKTKLISVLRHSANTGNAENIASTATTRGTSETSVV